MSKTIQPLVSIIITTYNREKIVNKNIDSILSQNYENKEIIVVDDFSTDNTEKNLKKYSNKIKYIKLSKNMGVQYASNIGFEKSSGEFLAFVGDDDVWIDKDKLNKQINVFLNDKKTDLGVVTTSVRILKRHTSYERIIKRPKKLLEHLLSGNDCIYGSAALIRRKAFIKAGKFDPFLKKGTDSDVFRRIVINGYNVYFIKDITIEYSELEKIRMSNFTQTNITRNIEAHLYKLEKYQKNYDQLTKAKSLVYSYLGNNYLLLYQKYKTNNSLNLSLKYFIKSLKLNFLTFRIYYKILIVYLYIVKKNIIYEK